MAVAVAGAAPDEKKLGDWPHCLGLFFSAAAWNRPRGVVEIDLLDSVCFLLSAVYSE